MGNSQQFLFLRLEPYARRPLCEWMSKGDDIARFLNLGAGIFCDFQLIRYLTFLRVTTDNKIFFFFAAGCKGGNI